MKPLFLLVFLTLTGCATSFTNWVKVAPGEGADVRGRMAALADEVAAAHGLTRDPQHGKAGEYQGYFGKPYHYYLFEIREVDGRPVAAFVHEARMSRRNVRREEPERDFMARAKEMFGEASVTSGFAEK